LKLYVCLLTAKQHSWFQILAEHQAKGLEDQALEADVLKKTKAAKKRAAKRTAPAVSRRARRGKADDDETEEEEEVEEPVSRAKAKKVPVKARVWGRWMFRGKAKNRG
jgi:hypothetical protein